jgi:2-methylisocitrate lyase-like PEP mutase family enzyme
MQKTKVKASLREQIEDNKKIIVLPGVFDALSARIAEQVGFDAMFQQDMVPLLHY